MKVAINVAAAALVFLASDPAFAAGGIGDMGNMSHPAVIGGNHNGEHNGDIGFGNSGNGNIGFGNSGNGNVGFFNSGNGNTGVFNSGNGNTGFLETR
jgi:PPE-repeat protein